MQAKPPSALAPETRAAQALGVTDPATGAVIPPLQLATTYTRNADYSARPTGAYIRDASPTVKHAEQVVCELEGGEEALGFGSGLGACTCLLYTSDAADE